MDSDTEGTSLVPSSLLQGMGGLLDETLGESVNAQARSQGDLSSTVEALGDITLWTTLARLTSVHRKWNRLCERSQTAIVVHDENNSCV